jgi:hypothetical protein
LSTVFLLLFFAFPMWLTSKNFALKKDNFL